MLCRPLNPNPRSLHPRFLLVTLLLPSVSRLRALQSPPLPPPSSTPQPISRFISTPAFTTASTPKCNTSMITSCHLLLFVSATASPCTHPKWVSSHLVASFRLSRTFAWIVSEKPCLGNTVPLLRSVPSSSPTRCGTKGSLSIGTSTQWRRNRRLSFGRVRRRCSVL